MALPTYKEEKIFGENNLRGANMSQTSNRIARYRGSYRHTQIALDILIT